VTDAPLQPVPLKHNGAGWAVFEHLIDEHIKDPAVVERMTVEQRLVFGLFSLRQEVDSGGFDSYFRYSGGDTAALALEGASLLSPRWSELIEDACRSLGSPYPLDIDTREQVLDRLEKEQPDLLARLDRRKYALEAEERVDDKVDVFIWAHRSSFFA
jgi:hypothetical protein